MADHDYNLAQDIGRHAAQEALRVIYETIDRLPQRDTTTKVLAAITAAGFLKARLEIMAEGMDARGDNATKVMNDICAVVKEKEGPELHERARAEREESVRNLHPGAPKA